MIDAAAIATGLKITWGLAVGGGVWLAALVCGRPQEPECPGPQVVALYRPRRNSQDGDDSILGAGSAQVNILTVSRHTANAFLSPLPRGSIDVGQSSSSSSGPIEQPPLPDKAPVCEICDNVIEKSEHWTYCAKCRLTILLEY